MRPEDKDAALLWDMREAALAIRTFMQGVSYARFEDDKMVRSAVERQFLIIGEAGRQVSQEFRDAHPEVPWRGVVGLRNVLAHEYGEVLVERLWLYATQRIPELIGLLDSLVPPATD
jgi:uncharacterized protein with HEPN domain